MGSASEAFPQPGVPAAVKPELILYMTWDVSTRKGQPALSFQATVFPILIFVCRPAKAMVCMLIVGSRLHRRST
ncbi:hypothetical protein AFLA_014092 [Aspergillus flavus NRRL3357]|nr:hypothetical protein AFLA_014092 [Aspergillus flavus NRRL3357]